uniref:Uncharacterized protein n=1 Tax=Rhizophora mucronata TaxID=61149 RepID=A0A2P2N503_RHIMU
MEYAEANKNRLLVKYEVQSVPNKHRAPLIVLFFHPRKDFN